MKCKLLIFTKGVTRGLGRFHSLKKDQGHLYQINLKKYQGHPNQMNLKKHQSHPDQMNLVPGSPGFTDDPSEKDRSLKKHQGQAM